MRNGLLKEIIKKEGAMGNRDKAPLIKLCETRWSQRHIAYTHFYGTYRY